MENKVESVKKLKEITFILATLSPIKILTKRAEEYVKILPVKV